jgi:hypothetical protein
MDWRCKRKLKALRYGSIRLENSPTDSNLREFNRRIKETNKYLKALKNKQEIEWFGGRKCLRKRS